MNFLLNLGFLANFLFVYVEGNALIMIPHLPCLIFFLTSTGAVRIYKTFLRRREKNFLVDRMQQSGKRDKPHVCSPEIFL